MLFSKINWKISLLVLACFAVVVLFIRLGFWQLSRAEEKLIIKASVETKSQQRIDLAVKSVDLNDRFTGVVAKGRYLEEHTLFLDRQLLKGVPAYAIITPFYIDKADKAILVNRGLVPATNDRGILPEIQTPGEPLLIEGNLNYPTQKPEFWRDSFPNEKNSVWQYLDMPLLQGRIQYNLEPLVLELNKDLDQVGGYVRQWRAYDDQWVNRHRAYALQWFSMAFVFVLMCFFAYRSRNK